MKGATKRVLVGLSMVAVLALLPSLWLRGEFQRTGAESKITEKDKPLTFVLVPKGVHPYFEPMYRGFKAAAAAFGANVEMDAPPTFDVGLQIRVIKDLIARRVDGIALSANDDQALIGVVHDAVEAGIKVITVDAPAPSTEALSYIGTDNESVGYRAGVRMAKALGGRGRLAILQGGMQSTNLDLRRRGFERALAEFGPRIRIVARIDEGGDFSESVDKTEELLEAQPDLDAIFSVSAEGAPAAALVVKRQRPARPVLIAGFDDLTDTLDGIRDGSIAFSVVQKVYKMGWLSVQELYRAVKKENVPKTIDTGVVFVDRKNVDRYAAGIEVVTPDR